MHTFSQCTMCINNALCEGNSSIFFWKAFGFIVCHLKIPLSPVCLFVCFSVSFASLMFQCLLEVNVSSPDGFPLSQLISTISLHPLSLPQLEPKLLRAFIPFLFCLCFLFRCLRSPFLVSFDCYHCAPLSPLSTPYLSFPT